MKISPLTPPLVSVPGAHTNDILLGLSREPIKQPGKAKLFGEYGNAET